MVTCSQTLSKVAKEKFWFIVTACLFSSFFFLFFDVSYLTTFFYQLSRIFQNFFKFFENSFKILSKLSNQSNKKKVYNFHKSWHGNYKTIISLVLVGNAPIRLGWPKHSDLDGFQPWMVYQSHSRVGLGINLQDLLTFQDWIWNWNRWKQGSSIWVNWIVKQFFCFATSTITPL